MPCPSCGLLTSRRAACRPLLPGRGLNTLFESYSWLDKDTIVAVPAGRPPRPQRPPTPPGPRVQTNFGGNVAQARTYADLLKDARWGPIRVLQFF